MHIFETVQCPLCGHDISESSSISGQFNIHCNVVICPNDGLVFLTPRWNKSTYNNFYKFEYDKYYSTTRILNKPMQDAIDLIDSRLAFLNILVQNKKILDIGSGMGWLLAHFKHKYTPLKLAAIEPSLECIQNLTSLGIEHLGCDAEHIVSNFKYDLIVMRHVLEHFLDPLQGIKNISDLIDDDGCIYIAVPNMMKPSGDLLSFWFRVVHTFYFSQTTLLALCEKANLYPLHIDSSTSEVWGVFIKKSGNKIPAQHLQENHKKQKELLIKLGLKI